MKLSKKVMTDSKLQLKKFKLQNIIQKGLKSLTDRNRDILSRRFGLKNGENETLESIGRGYKVTRERIRQIEADSIRDFLRNDIKLAFQPFWEYVGDYLKNHGGLKREETLLKDLSDVLAVDNKTEIDSKAAILTALLLNNALFQKICRDDKFYPSWSYKNEGVKFASAIIGKVIKVLEKGGETVVFDDLVKIFKNTAFSKSKERFSLQAIHSYIDAAKIIGKNSFNEFGLAYWHEINPRGARDRAFLVMKKEDKPLHFTEVADLINHYQISPRKVYVQTVHNELIKDPRFILVGRGTYALKEWGNEQGTVKEIIARVLKEASRPLSKEEVLNRVLNLRQVRENTVLLNLQDRNLFAKNKDGFYSLAIINFRPTA